MTLDRLLDDAVARAPGRRALETVDGAALSYAELDARAHDVARRLAAHGVGAGDRVGIHLPKSPDSVAALFGTMRAGAAYVPVDDAGPLDRNATILDDCAVRAVVVGHGRADALAGALAGGMIPAGPLGDEALLLVRRDAAPAEVPAPPPRPEDALAYILYTSGSTGRPKGVALTHANALSFVRWCEGVLDVGPDDRFSSHAPFHFDLSILDIYLCVMSAGTLVLVDEETGRQPRRLAPLIAERRLSVWYSTPSILSLLVQHGRLERHDASALRYVLFAGEVFPARHLRALAALWPRPRYFNLYGPTETNVCTFHEVSTPVPDERSEPYPIGEACAHVETAVCDERGAPVADGEEGELCVRGAPVTAGYWGLPERTARAFHAGGWYRTGDVVRRTAEGYVYVGRRDRMVKRRGHRVELGEVEARLYRHPDVAEVAVVALPDADQGVRIRAFVRWRDGRRPSLVALKAFCAEHVPASMVPDAFAHVDALPRTSTDKVDYVRLGALP